MKILFLWMLSLGAQSADQCSENNCLCKNPGVLDVVFYFFHQDDDNTRNLNTTAEDIANAVLLIAKRFKRIHMFLGNSDTTMRNIQGGMSLYFNWTGTYFPMFLYPPYINDQGTNIRSIIKSYEKAKNAASRINIDQENLPVVGLYLDDLYSPRDIQGHFSEMKAVERVFKQANNSSFLLGHLLNPCSLDLYRGHSEHLKRLQFITCHLYLGSLSELSETLSPEDYADKAIRNCDQFRDNATYLNLTAEVLCIAEYTSQKTNDNGLVYSVQTFQKFWCRIVEELVRNKSHAGIIMSAAFDLTPGHDGHPVDDLFASEQNTGWWRRRSFHKPGEFVEKVEELTGGKEYGKCRGPCDLCSSSNECCGELYCAPDSSIPPFEGRPPSVCRSKKAKCGESMESIFVTEYSILTVAILGVSTILLFTVVVFFFVYRKITANNVLSRQELRHFFEGCTSSAGRPSEDDTKVHKIAEDLPYDRQLEILKSNFEIYENQILGSGEFGVVVKGRVGNDEVAVKTTLRGVDKVYFKALLSELKVLMHLGYHEAIVTFFGANTSQLASAKECKHPARLQQGKLLDAASFLQNCFREDTKVYKGNSQEGCRYVLTGKILLKWSVQIASALEYLGEKKVIHGDVAARNILVFSWDQVKLADFGLSRRLYERSNYIKQHQGPLPWRHMSVEALKDLSFSLQSDIWAFGVTMWELFSLGEIPFPGRLCSEEFVQLLLSGLRPLQPKHAPIIVYEIMKSCWTTDVKLRPAISLIRSKLTLALDQLYTNKLYLNLPGIK